MSKDDLPSWDTTAANNTDVGGINIQENAPFANMNNMGREMMAQAVRELADKGSDITAAATTNIAATGTSGFAKITGTTTITSFGTPTGEPRRWIHWGAATPVTHNATSMILLGGASRTHAAGDISLFAHEGSGNWRELVYQPATGYVSAGSSGTITSSDAGATGGPSLILLRSSASPAASDLIGQLIFEGKDSGGNTENYAYFIGSILDPTNGSEDGRVSARALVAGADTAIAHFGPGVQIGAPTGGDQGAGTLNVDGDIYKDGVKVTSGTVISLGRATSTTYQTCSTDLPVDNTIPQNTEGDEILSVSVTPRSASSTIRIRAIFNVGATSQGQAAAALFSSAVGANALNAVEFFVDGTTSLHSVAMEYTESAASTSARTYSIRLGPDVGAAASVRLNGDGSTRLFGGVAIARMEVEEILP